MSGTSNYRIHRLVEEGSQTQILSNVHAVESFNKIDGIKKASIHLIKNKIGEPILVVHYHANSEDEKERSSDLKLINEAVHTLREKILKERRLNIKDWVIMGDFNQNIFKDREESQPIQLDSDVLKKIIGSVGKGFNFCDIAIPRGCLTKQRGLDEEGRLYNLYLNPQINKDKLLIKNDSKDFILHFKFETGSLVDKQAEILIQKNEIIKKSQIPFRNFLHEDTGFRDHYGSEPMQIGNIVLTVDSYLPTHGLKAIKDPHEFYTDDALKNHEVLLNIQELSTLKLFSLLGKKFNVPEDEIKLNTNNNIKNTLKTLNDAARVLNNTHANIVLYFQEVIESWCQSEEYLAALNLLQVHIREKVTSEMKDTLWLKAPVETFLNNQKFDLMGKIIQLCGQKQLQEMSGGYSLLNGIAFPGPKRVDKAHIKSTVEQIKFTPGVSYYTLQTEAGKNNKGDYFNTKLNKAINKHPINEWIMMLSTYFEKNATVDLKEKFDPLINHLKLYNKICKLNLPLLNRENEKNLEQQKDLILEIIKKNVIFYQAINSDLAQLLTTLSLQISKHFKQCVKNPKSKERALVGFFNSRNQEEIIISRQISETGISNQI